MGIRELLKGRRGWLAVLILAVAVGLCACGAADPYGCRIAPEVRVGDLALGGMTPWEAWQALREEAQTQLFDRPLEAALPEQTLELTREAVGLRLNVLGILKDAWRCGRDQEAGPALELSDYLRLDQEAVTALLAQYAAQFDSVYTPWTAELEEPVPELSTDGFDPSLPCPGLVVTLGTSERHLDIPAALEATEDAYGWAFDRDFDQRVAIAVPAERSAAAPELEELADAFCAQPVNDGLDLERYAFVHGSYGYGFQQDQAQALLNGADEGAAVTIPLSWTRPEILGDEVYFRDELGSCQTRHNTNENRNTNLRLLCQALDGVVVEPGQTFSYNETVGERTAERGYKPAPAYSGNRLVDSIGGGVCQGSTTLYNCVLLADLEVVARSCHAAAVSYVPKGLDAAVNWGTTDFQFRNNFHFPVKITAEVSDGYVKMRLLGTDEKDYYIEMTTGIGSSNELVTYAVSYKNKYSKETGELLSREREALSSYYHNIG